MLAGIVIGATAVSGLYARGKGPGAYAIVDISEITDPAAFKTLLPKAGQANDQFGGKFVARTENIACSNASGRARPALAACVNSGEAGSIPASAETAWRSTEWRASNW